MAVLIHAGLVTLTEQANAKVPTAKVPAAAKVPKHKQHNWSKKEAGEHKVQLQLSLLGGAWRR